MQAYHVFYDRKWKRSFESLIRENPGIDAVLCAAGGYVAHGFLKKASKQHVDVPGTISLVGFDDIEMSSDTGLTTVRQPLDEMGRSAFNAAVRAINEPKALPENIVFENELVIRDTA
ncbi:MAG TPA: substrate-binding domain-containing protein [Candidatus Goldiibacteriota bacterium]|nr:substrate-binding domain-containing protein [Candidatus Goldiibacteriota bacterium]